MKQLKISPLSSEIKVTSSELTLPNTYILNTTKSKP
jgi:hypothetical protein